MAHRELRRIRWDTWSGMLYSDLAAFFIILATAVTLNRAGITDITTAAQAASALRPLAGDFAFLLFALGILAVGFIGVPVLAGSGAYALSEAAGWNWGLERKATDARGFYGVIAVSVLAALVIQYSPISPMTVSYTHLATDPSPLSGAWTVSPQIIQASCAAGRGVADPAEQPQVAGRVDPGTGRVARSRHIAGRGGALGAINPGGIVRVPATEPCP